MLCLSQKIFSLVLLTPALTQINRQYASQMTRSVDRPGPDHQIGVVNFANSRGTHLRSVTHKVLPWRATARKYLTSSHSNMGRLCIFARDARNLAAPARRFRRCKCQFARRAAVATADKQSSKPPSQEREDVPMTDHPRFRIATLNSDICYRHYHGAAAVEWSFRAADWWLSRRERMSQDKPGTQMRSRVALRVACLAGLLALCSAASADDPARTDGDKYKVRFENDRVRVLEYRDRPGEKTHQHRHPAFVLSRLARLNAGSPYRTAKGSCGSSRLEMCSGRMRRLTSGRMSEIRPRTSLWWR